MPRTVIQHVLSRLHDLGVRDVFGVPGDYAFPVNDTVCSDSRLRWVEPLSGAAVAEAPQHGPPQP